MENIIRGEKYNAFWDKMRKDIRNFVASCEECTRERVGMSTDSSNRQQV